MVDKNIKGDYGVSKNGNFFIKDTINISHPYCLEPRHVAHAADHFGGMLGKEAIISGEKQGIMCAIKGCNLTYEMHETALLIACKKDPKTDPVAKKECEVYLKKIVKEAEDNGYAGFAFMMVD